VYGARQSVVRSVNVVLISTYELGRQPFASGRKTCESSVIGVGVGGRVEVARAVAAAVGVAVGAALELAADGVLVGATAAGAEHPAIVSANSAATTKRMPSG